MRAVLAVIGLAASASLASAQGRPADFRVRFDRPMPDSLFQFQTMSPGWHITTSRPAGIVWRPAQSANGNWRLDATIHLFPRPGHAEGVGVIFGGSDLDGPNQSYVYFLIRKDGQFLIKRRQGAATSDIVGWTPHAAVVQQPRTEGDESVRNDLAVEVTANEVRFFINGQRVHAMPRAGLTTDGLVGLRVNHNLNIHVSRLDLTQR